ncbi:MAG: amidohydrolase family protein [Lactobacillales bacterium]|nr:amidohydrolase family protein [Lactobacillales bacterium]
MKLDVLLTNGYIVKNETLKKYDIGIVGNKIQSVEEAGKFSYISEKTIDSTGLFFLPGFIDSHSHTDEAALNDIFNSKLFQGITSEICGNCGGSPAPINSEKTYKIRREVKSCEDNWYTHFRWMTFREYFKIANQKKLTCNHLYFVGLWTLYENSQSEQDLIILFENALESGCIGLSINQGHKSWTSLSVITKRKIFEILKYHNKIFSVHLANYSNDFMANISEIFTFIKKYRVKIVYSHIKFYNPTTNINYNYFTEIFDQTCFYTEARFDLYPFDSICTRLSSILNNSNNQLGGIKQIKILSNGANIQTVNGKIIPKDRAYLEHLLNKSDLLVSANGINQNTMFKLLANKHSFIGSDYSSFKICKNSLKTNHERGYSSFLKSFKLLMNANYSLESTISKLSYNPAIFYNIKNRGKILRNYYADIIICNITDDYDLCIEQILVNGKIAYDKKSTSIIKHGNIL